MNTLLVLATRADRYAELLHGQDLPDLEIVIETGVDRIFCDNYRRFAQGRELKYLEDLDKGY